MRPYSRFFPTGPGRAHPLTIGEKRLIHFVFVFFQSELSAKLEPARPGQTLSRLLRGELGPRYEPAVGVLWERKEDEPSGSRGQFKEKSERIQTFSIVILSLLSCHVYTRFTGLLCQCQYQTTLVGVCDLVRTVTVRFVLIVLITTSIIFSNLLHRHTWSLSLTRFTGPLC